MLLVRVYKVWIAVGTESGRLACWALDDILRSPNTLLPDLRHKPVPDSLCPALWPSFNAYSLTTKTTSKPVSAEHRFEPHDTSIYLVHKYINIDNIDTSRCDILDVSYRAYSCFAALLVTRPVAFVQRLIRDDQDNPQAEWCWSTDRIERVDLYRNIDTNRY